MDAKKQKQLDKWNKMTLESQKRYQEKQASQLKGESIAKKTSPRKQGKTRLKVVNWQNILKNNVKGLKCQNVLCTNILGLDGTNIVCEHILPQGKYPEYRMQLRNVKFVCGCVNLDDHKGEDRCKAIARHFPDILDWYKENK